MDDWPIPSPNGCRYCGEDERDHYRRWTEAAGWHKWATPTDAQRLERMLARRAARLATKPEHVPTPPDLVLTLSADTGPLVRALTAAAEAAKGGRLVRGDGRTLAEQLLALRAPAPPGTNTVLVIGYTGVWCGYCGERTRPDTTTHETVTVGITGCGARFGWITCDQPALTTEWRIALTEMRRDLPIAAPGEIRDALGHDPVWLR